MQKGKSLLAKIVMLCLAVTCCFALVLGATSCGKEVKDPTFAINDNGHLIVTTYDAKGEVKETKDLGAVTGLKGDKGDKGDQGEQGPKGDKGEDGKLEHGHEGVAFEDYELQEANCQQDGKTIRVFADGCAELLTTEGGHDFSLAAIEAGEMPANLRVTALVPDEGHESAYEIDDEGHESLNGTARATIKCLVCGEETEVEISLADDYTVDAVDPTHTEKGYRKAFVTYTADGVKYEHQLIEYDVFDEVGDHFFNGNAINAGLTYTLDQIKEIFGEDYTTFTNKEIGCGEDGYAYFVCEECGKNVLLYVRNNHKWGEPEVVGYNDVDGVLLKFVCEECGVELENYADESKYVESNCAAAAHVDWTYELDGEELSDTWTVPGATLNLNAHRYENAAGKFTVLDVNREYRVSELDAIFDKGDYTLSGAERDCHEIYGQAIFNPCADCGKLIVLNRILDDHELELDKDDDAYHVGEDYVKLVFSCKNCGEGRQEVDAIAYKSITVYDDTEFATAYTVDKDGKITVNEEVVVDGEDCEHGIKKFLVYTYEEDGEIKTATMDLAGSKAADKSKHKLNGTQLDLNNVYTHERLEDLFGKELTGITVAANEAECKNDGKVGSAVFTCDICKQVIVLKVRAAHTLEVVSDLMYEAEDDTYTGAGLTTEDKTGVTGTLKLHCKVCGQTFDDVEFTVTKDRKLATCKEDGYYKVSYTYTVDKEVTVPLNGENGEVLLKNKDGHTFGDKTFSENELYTVAQIKEIFGTEYTLAGNELSCTDDTTGKAVVKCETCKNIIVLNVKADHDYKLVDSNFSWEDKDEGVEVDEGTLVQVYLKFKCQACDDEEEEFKKVYIAKKVAQTNKEDGKIYVEYTYTLNGVDYDKEEVLKVIPKDPSLHIYTDKDGNVHTFSDDNEYEIEELREIFGDDLVEFDNDEYHAAFVCEDEECGLVLINVLPEGRA